MYYTLYRSDELGGAALVRYIPEEVVAELRNAGLRVLHRNVSPLRIKRGGPGYRTKSGPGRARRRTLHKRAAKNG